MGKGPDQRSGLWKPAVLLAGVVCLVAAARVFHWGGQVESLKAWIASLGAWGPAAYTLLYVAAVVAAVPGSVLTVLAGALFGSVLGTVVVSIGSTVGAALCFLIARYFARGAVEKWASRSGKFRRLDELTARQGAVIVAVTRLIPLFPFNLLNYGFGLTRVGFRQYTFWSWLCMLPGTLLYVVGADALTKALSQGKIPWTLAGALAAVLVVLMVVVRAAKKRLDAKGS